ncbi:hypothetical protein Val02_35400 [Virgisporangium aliadipatigenens]|uniref:Uncharacterized protein n=1 Tax=Virgisporangium aliadipatigenens TaxID=741659 RepID=A0A8J3YJV1_9ACTN|nr:hypothetical protein [Virgisporangium aliadipatigenens]GIJ46654.1 hypothetical protein Val02_35400 [Virgisporangium aliadipatigenens]
MSIAVEPDAVEPDTPEESPQESHRSPVALVAERLFLTAPSRPVTWRAVVLALAAVAVGTIVGVNRARGPGALNTVWAEDGSILLTDALNEPFWTAVTTPLNGYYITVPRLLGEVAAIAPISLSAVALSAIAAACAAGIALLVYVVSRAHVPSPVLRLVIAAPVVVTPVGALFTPHTIVTQQFLLLYALFWLLLWVPTTRAGRIFGVAFAVLSALTTILVVALLPLAIFRAVATRGRQAFWLLGGLVIGLAVQVGGLVSGAASRAGISHPRPDPAWALLEFVVYGLPYSVLGQKWLEPPVNHQNGNWVNPHERPAEHAVLVLLAWVVIGLVVYLAVRRVTKPAWVLAAVAAAHAFGIFALEIMAMGYDTDSYLVDEKALIWTDRYLVPAMLLLTVTVVALLRPDGDPGFDPAKWPANVWPVVAYVTLLVVVCAVNFRHDNPRSYSQPWRKEVRAATATCKATAQKTVTIGAGSTMWGNKWPQVVIPCDRLRD